MPNIDRIVFSLCGQSYYLSHAYPLETALQLPEKWTAQDVLGETLNTGSLLENFRKIVGCISVSKETAGPLLTVERKTLFVRWQDTDDKI